MKKVMLFLAPLLSLVTVLAVTLPAIGSSGMAMGPRRPGPRESTSSNWSGYAVENVKLVPKGKHQSEVIADDNVSVVIGTWTVPTVIGSPNSGSTYSSCWVGIDGYSDSTVEQIGTEQDYDATTGQTNYYAWYEMYPAPYHTITSGTVNPGDTMTAKVQYVSTNNTFNLTLSDAPANGTGWTYTTNQALPSGSTALRQSAEAIVEAPSMINGVLPLADFDNVTFSNVEANGYAFNNKSAWSMADNITMVDGTAEAIPTPLESSEDGGNSFTVNYSTYSPSPHGHGNGNGHGKN